MKRKTILILVSAVIVACAIAWIVGHATPEPTYEGKPLKYWLAMLDKNPGERAFASFGNKATPFIIDELRARDTKLSAWWRQFATKRGWKFVAPAPAHRHRRAVLACSILRTNAVEAVPYLERLLLESPPTGERLMVLHTLTRMEAPGTLVLVRALTNSEPRLRVEARGMLQLNYQPGGSSNPVPVIKFLLNQLHSASKSERLHAVEALGFIFQVRDQTSPALAECASDPDEEMRVAAIVSLGFLRATNAEPTIRRALEDREHRVRLAATNALKQLRPVPAVSYE